MPLAKAGASAMPATRLFRFMENQSLRGVLRSRAGVTTERI